MERVASGSVEEVLERAVPIIMAGRAIVISVEAIRECSEERWPRKREQVATFVTRAFHRIAQPSDMILPLNDVEFLTLHPDSSSMAAVNRSCNVLKECLLFFLGASAPEDIRLLQVTSFAGGALSVQPVDPAALQAIDQEGDWDRIGGEADPSGLEPATLLRSVHLEPPGIDLEITTHVRPVWNVGAEAVASFLLRAEVASSDAHPSRLAHLGPALGREVGLSVVEHAQQLLSGEKPLRAGVHVPIPAAALAHSSSRYLILEALKSLPPSLRRFLILEITGLSPGVPQTRLLECVGVLSPFGRVVLARAPALSMDFRGWAGCGLAGIALDCSGLSAELRKAPALLAAFAEAALRIAPSCAAYRLPSRSLVLAAWAAGFTHLSGDAISRATGDNAWARRLSPIDLYGELR